MISPSRMDYFFLVPKIITTAKYIDTSRDGIERRLNDEGGQIEYEWEEVIEDDFHNEHFVPLQLNISCKAPLIVSWAISLKLHRIRIDGIDWHRRFIDPNGEKQYGWHRHEFDAHEQTADHRRVPTDILQNAQSRADFLIRTLKQMNILLSGVDHGNYELFSNTPTADQSAE